MSTTMTYNKDTDRLEFRMAASYGEVATTRHPDKLWRILPGIPKEFAKIAACHEGRP